MNEIIIHEKKNTDRKPLAAGIGMLIASVFVLVTGILDGSILFDIVGIAGILYFGYCTIYAVIGLSRERQLLVAGEDGITDTSMASGSMHIPYEQMESVEVFRALKEPYIGIRLKDQESFLAGLSGRNRAVVKSNLQLNCPPVCLRVNRAKEMDIDAIADLIRGRMEG